MVNFAFAHEDIQIGVSIGHSIENTKFTYNGDSYEDDDSSINNGFIYFKKYHSDEHYSQFGIGFNLYKKDEGGKSFMGVFDYYQLPLWLW